MRLLIAMMKHETNTFSPVPTPLARFRPLYGEAAIRAFRGTGTGLGAYLDLAEREGAEIVVPIAAGAPPSSPVDDSAYTHITDTICEAVARGGFDGIMLDLHGAMVTESLEDGEGQFLKRLWAIAPDTPIAVSLDMHANLYDEIIANATVVTGYRTYPHIDTYETAKLAGEILLRTIRGEVRPVMAWGNEPMLPHVMRQGTDDHPNKELQHRCAAMSAEGALAASLFTGFPHADISNAGLSAVVITDGDLKLNPALVMSAWGKPVKRLAANAPSALIAAQRCCNSLFGWSSVPCRITCGSIGSFPQAMTGLTSPRIARSRISPASRAVSSVSI